MGRFSAKNWSLEKTFKFEMIGMATSCTISVWKDNFCIGNMEKVKVLGAERSLAYDVSSKKGFVQGGGES